MGRKYLIIERHDVDLQVMVSRIKTGTEKTLKDLDEDCLIEERYINIDLEKILKALQKEDVRTKKIKKT